MCSKWVLRRKRCNLVVTEVGRGWVFLYLVERRNAHAQAFRTGCVVNSLQNARPVASDFQKA